MARTLLGGCITAATLLSACGGATKTVSVAGAPPVTSPPATSPPSTGTSPKPGTTNGGTAPTTSQPSTTRTAPEPAFAEHEAGKSTNGGEGASAAAAVVRAHGYTPNDTSQYHANQTLRVLVGTHTGSGDGYGQQAFFFLQGRYIGTDTSAPSATLKVVSQSDTSVTLAYPLYRSKDALCCPSGGQANVRFELNNGKLSPAQAIPPLRSSTGLSRY
jgi:LppP/LprE lipoprotein